MTTMTITPSTAVEPAAPKKLPHATYTIGGQKRALLTIDTGEDSKLMDVPAALLDIATSGRRTADSYLVEEGLSECDATGELQALVVDYLSVAERHQAIPMTVFAM